MATKRAAVTLSKAVDSGVEIRECIREETLLLHCSEVYSRNTLEGRVLATIKLPDGSVFVAERVIKLKFKREARDAG
jgi:hypothetical protein